jgi:hypothetical protein
LYAEAQGSNNYLRPQKLLELRESLVRESPTAIDADEDGEASNSFEILSRIESFVVIADSKITKFDWLVDIQVCLSQPTLFLYFHSLQCKKLS